MGVDCQIPRPGRFTPGKYTGGWVGPRAGLDGCREAAVSYFVMICFNMPRSSMAFPSDFATTAHECTCSRQVLYMLIARQSWTTFKQ